MKISPDSPVIRDQFRVILAQASLAILAFRQQTLILIRDTSSLGQINRSQIGLPINDAILVKLKIQNNINEFEKL